MKLPFVAICVVALVTTFVAANPLHVFDFFRNNKAPWQLYEALTASSQLKGFNGTWISGDAFYFTSSKGLEQYNAATNKQSTFVPSSFLEKYKGPSLTLSPNSKKILVRHSLTQVFRHSYVAKYDILDVETGVSKPIHGEEKLQYCQWAPNSDKVAYVYKNNVYIQYVDDSKPQVQITKDGVDGIVYNGIPDWVYEEEVLSAGSAIWWSPDGNKVTVGFFNDTKVETFRYYLYGDENNAYQYPEEQNLKYPKPNTPNPVVSLKVYDLTNINQEPNLITAPIDIVTSDHILQHVAWGDNNNMIIFWLNRRQNVGAAQLCQVNGICKEVTKFEEPNGWIALGAPSCKSGFCWFTYWVGNWYQIWKLDLITGKNVQETLGEQITVQKFYGSNDNGDIFYQATLSGKPHVSHVFKNQECLSCNLKDIDEVACQMASGSFSKTFEYYSLTCTGPSPYYSRIFGSSKGLVKSWENNESFRNNIYAFKSFPNIKFLNVTLGDGSHGIAKLYLPPTLNFEKPDARKYPLIVMVYGGPNSVRVNSQFTIGWEAYLTTSREVIYAVIDGRGTGNKGKDLLFTVNNHLGTVEIEDQIGVTRSLIENYKFIDSTKTGIWGWSYGGYVTAMTLSKDDSHVFRCGVSVAPVTAWYYYDTIYTERYMGLPTKEDNLANYEKGDISQDINNFRTHKFLLIHGSGDDNVHIQHSLLLAKKLQYADIDFEEMTYTDENHSIGNALPHLYHTMDNFWGQCFQ